MNTRKKPCEQCPWRKDTRRGQFPAERYDQLADTTGSPGAEAGIGAPIFGCHKSSEEEPMPCAGWLAAVGYESLTVRLALSNGSIRPEALEPGDDWPPLFESYEEMRAAQGGTGGTWSMCATKGCRAYMTPQTVTPGFPCPTCGRGEMVAVDDDTICRLRQADNLQGD